MKSSAILRARVIVGLSLAAAIAYLCRQPLGVAESTISAELGLNKIESGILMGTFFWSYAFFQLPGGWLGHAWGNRRALSLFAVAWSLAMVLTGLSTTFVFLLVAQLVMGAAQAGIFPCSALVMRRWLPVDERGVGQGTVAGGMQLGAITTAALTGWMLGQQISWRWVFMLYSVPGLIWAAWFFLRFEERPVAAADSEQRPSDQVSVEAAHSPTPWKHVFSHVTMWFICAQQSFRTAGYIFFATWFPSFLQKTRGLSIEKSGWMQSGLLAAAMLGVLLGGVLADRLYRRMDNLRRSRALLGAGGQVVCGSLIFTAFFVTSVPLAISLMAAGAFFASLGGPSATSVAIDIGGQHVGKVYAIMNMSGNFAAALCPVVIGWIFHTTENWNIVLLLFAGIYFSAAACWFFIDPTVDVTKPKGDSC